MPMRQADQAALCSTLDAMAATIEVLEHQLEEQRRAYTELLVYLVAQVGRGGRTQMGLMAQHRVAKHAARADLVRTE